MSAATATPAVHIHLDAAGKAWIDDTNVKVIEVACDKLAYGWSPEEMHAQHPDLSLAQIHAALSYYYDHQEAFDAEIARQAHECEEARQKTLDSPMRKKLRAAGKIP